MLPTALSTIAMALAIVAALVSGYFARDARAAADKARDKALAYDELERQCSQLRGLVQKLYGRVYADARHARERSEDQPDLPGIPPQVTPQPVYGMRGGPTDVDPELAALLALQAAPSARPNGGA